MPTAYSYVRFSTKKQAEGDSLRRQTDKARNWCEANGYTLSDQNYQDLGVSSFRGTNVTKGALGEFLKVAGKKVKPGSVLVVESLDRVSRQDIWETVPLLRQILKAGVDIVTLIPVAQRLTAQSDDMEILWAMLDVIRSRKESLVKSDRLKESWTTKRQQAARKEKIINGHLPTWLQRDGNKWIVDPEQKATIRRIFTLALTMGGYSIAKQLNAEGVKTLGLSKHWNDGVVTSLLRNRRVIGYYQPRNDKRQAMGHEIEGYYPVIVDKDLFYRVQEIVKRRKRLPGRSGDGCACLFTGLWRDPSIDLHWTLVRRTYKDNVYTYMYPAGADRGLVIGYCFKYPLFERAFLHFMKELTPEDFGDVGSQVDADITTARGSIADLDYRIDQLTDSLRTSGDFEAGLMLLRRLEEDRKKSNAELEELLSKSTVSPMETLRATECVLERIDKAKGLQLTELRRQLKTHIAELFSTIDVLVYKRDGFTCLDCQANFRSGGCRQFCLWYRPQRNADDECEYRIPWGTDQPVQPKPKHDLHNYDPGLYRPMYERLRPR